MNKKYNKCKDCDRVYLIGRGCPHCVKLRNRRFKDKERRKERKNRIKNIFNPWIKKMGMKKWIIKETVEQHPILDPIEVDEKYERK